MQENSVKKKITIYDVAHEAGVSLATVSRVINDSTIVKKDTADKVQKAIIKLGYKPNAVAQGLALKKTTNIALLIPLSPVIGASKILNGLLDVAKIYKYNVMLYSYSHGINEINDIVDNIVKSRADGFIVYNDSLDEGLIETLSSYGIPVVYLENKVDIDNVSCVYVDYKNAVKNLVSSYLKKGIDDIIVVDDPKSPGVVSQILNGTKEAYKEVGKKFNNFIETPNRYQNSYVFLTDYFKEHKHQLVLTCRDSQAMAVMNACTENGIKIPEETQLICVMDSRYNDMVRPQISSFVTQSYDLGALAMRIMTKRLTNQDVKIKDYKLDCIFSSKGTTLK